MRKTLALFNSLLALAVKTPVEEVTLENLRNTIEQKNQEKVKYKSSNTEVKLGDCTPPVIIAYHLLQFNQKEQQPEKTKAAIKEKLQQLFAHIGETDFSARNHEYLAYLTASSTSQEVIVEAHREFLTQYLQEHSQKLNLVQRWLGYESKLSRMVNNQNYLLMFYAFSGLSNNPVIGLEAIQKTINSLLDEYIETSWFISSERKAWAILLKRSVQKAKDIDTLIRVLSKTQVEAAKHDIEVNEKHPFRCLKPLHLFGDSRFQNILSGALI